MVRVDGEVDQGAAGEDRVVRVAVGAVLGLGVLNVLPGERVLELGGGDGDAVDQQRHVERVHRAGLGVVQLPDDTEPVGGVPLGLLVVEAARGLEVAQPHLDAGVLDGAAQHADGAAVVDGLGQTVEEALGGGILTAVTLHELRPRLGL